MLSDEELEALAGGGPASMRWGYSVGCAKCNTFWSAKSNQPGWHTCPNCGDKFYA